MGLLILKLSPTLDVIVIIVFVPAMYGVLVAVRVSPVMVSTQVNREAVYFGHIVIPAIVNVMPLKIFVIYRAALKPRA